MFEIGDKLKCIKTTYYDTGHDIVVGKIYTIINCRDNYNFYNEIVRQYLIDDNSSIWFDHNSPYMRNYLISVKELRKQKLKQICLKSEIK